MGYLVGMLYGGRSLYNEMQRKAEELPAISNRICSKLLFLFCCWSPLCRPIYTLDDLIPLDIRLENCSRSCDPLPIVFCKAMDLDRLPKVIEDFPVVGLNTTTSKPILRLHVPQNRIVLQDTMFVPFVLERL